MDSVKYCPFVFLYLLEINNVRKQKFIFMRTKEIVGSQPFQIESSHSFAVSPSSQGYTFMYSTDGYNYTAWPEDVPANENLVVNGIATGMYFYFDGNEDTVTIAY